jgi:hypothetical protein
MPSSFSSIMTLDGLSNPYLRAISIGIISVELIFPLKKIAVIFFKTMNHKSSLILNNCDHLYHSVTNGNVEKITDYKKKQKDENKQIIYIILKNEGTCYPKDIKKRVDFLANEIAEEEFEKGDIDEKEKEKIFKKNTIARETIQRNLKEMVDEGSVIKENGKYFLSDLALSDLRYFSPDSGRQFGSLLLNELLKLHYPTIDDFKTNIQKLVEILGFYLLYTLVEACRPIKIQNDDKYFENKTKDVLTEKWFEQAINHQTLLDAFISTVTNQYNDEQREEYFKKHHKIIDEDHGQFEYIRVNDPNKNEIENMETTLISDPMSASDFSLKRFYYLASKEFDIKYKTTSNPLYELSQNTVYNIDNILEEKYPYYYYASKFAKMDYFGRPKEGSLKGRRSNFEYSNYETKINS